MIKQIAKYYYRFTLVDENVDRGPISTRMVRNIFSIFEPPYLEEK
jgi:hypothetical protein